MSAQATRTTRLIRDTGVAGLLDVSRRTVWALVASDPSFPVSVRVGRCRRWVEAEIETWALERALRDVPPSRRSRRTREG
jgi:predicted DNA-binding transcriptional regulator AlpA